LGFCLVEGADGTGKTMLCEELLAEYVASSHHVGPPRNPVKAFSEYVSDLRGMCVSGGNWVVERFHLGTHVYGTAFRTGPDLDDLEWSLLEEMLAEEGVLLVLCVPPMETVLAALAKKDAPLDLRMYDDPSRATELRSLFDEAYERSVLHKTRYDWTTGDRSAFDLPGWWWERR